MSQTNQADFTPLVREIIEGIENVKGHNITVLDLRDLENSVCEFFVICEGNSNTQVSALSNAIEKQVRESLKEKPWHIEGYENSEWVLMDYVDVVVHIFQPEFRTYYDIESLWSDAQITSIPTL
jgi:ribosome-associated protein